MNTNSHNFGLVQNAHECAMKRWMAEGRKARDYRRTEVNQMHARNLARGHFHVMQVVELERRAILNDVLKS